MDQKFLKNVLSEALRNGIGLDKTANFIMKIFAEDRREVWIKKVIFHDPVTVVLWTDGTKTVVKAAHEPYDPEKGLAMAIAKKAMGNTGAYYNEFRKWLPEPEYEVEGEEPVEHDIVMEGEVEIDDPESGEEQQ